ncbi:MAG: transposase [Janthinobacterium lividum]
MRGKGVEPYPRDVTDEEWAFVLPYLLLCREDSPQRKHDLRTVFNAVRYVTVTPADHGDREQVAALAEQVQQIMGGTVELAYVDQGYTGPNAAEAAQQHGLRLEVVKHPMVKRGFVLLPRRWVIERSFASAARFRRLARDYERLDTTLKDILMLRTSPIP